MTEGGNGGPQEGTPRGVAANALHSAMTAARESTAHKGNVIHIGPPNRYGDSPLEVAHAQVRLAGAKNLLPAVVHSLLDLVNSFPQGARGRASVTQTEISPIEDSSARGTADLKVADHRSALLSGDDNTSPSKN